MTQHPDVEGFFDEATNTVSYILRDPDSSACAIINSVLDYDIASGRTSTASADKIIAAIKERATQGRMDSRNPRSR